MPYSELMQVVARKKKRWRQRNPVQTQGWVKPPTPSLYEFFLGAWDVLEPSREISLNWHIELICEHLELVSDGDTLQLLINIAPRHLKSRIISVAFPCWKWIDAPHTRFMCLSYSGSLANDLSQDRRKLIQSEYYQNLVGGMKLASDKNRISEFANNKGGQMVARGLDGSVTGGGGDFLIFDDPNNPETIESDDVRRSTERKFRSYSVTRRDSKATRVIVVQQRTHESDITGLIQAEVGGYTELILPTKADAVEEIVFPKSGKVVHRDIGDFLHPERFGKAEDDEARKTLGSYLYAARHAQAPAPAKGGIFKIDYFGRYNVHPTGKIYQSWDTASKDRDVNCPWVCHTILDHGGSLYLIDVFRKRMEYPEGKRMVQSLALGYNPEAILIEDEGTGQSLLQEMKLEGAMLPGGAKKYFNLIAIQPKESKLMRAMRCTTFIEAKRMQLPVAAEWLPEFLNELSKFPFSTYKDQVDALSQFLIWYQDRERQQEKTNDKLVTKIWGKR